MLTVYGIRRDPPCALSEYVQFISNACPYSGEESCEDCISNKFDAECVEWLKSSKKFGET